MNINSKMDIQPLVDGMKEWMSHIEIDKDKYAIEIMPGFDQYPSYGKVAIKYENEVLFFINFYQKYGKSKDGHKCIHGMFSLRVHPNEFNKALEFLGLNKFSPYNMFIMKKGIYDKFAEWEFAIFNEMEKHVKLSSYSRQRRLYGYLSEPLLSMFAYINGLSVKFDKVTEYPGKQSWQHWTLAGTISTAKKKIVFQLINNFKSRPAYPPEHMKFDAVRVGLKNDGIKI